MPDDSELLFDVRNLSKTFGKRVALDIPQLQIRRGKMTAILGVSGSGKTTLLNILGGLDRAHPETAIKVRLDGDRWRDLGQFWSRSMMSRRASYVFQQGYLLSNASLMLNLRVATGGLARGATITDAIERAGLGPDLAKDSRLLARRTWSLSGGQLQRLNVARAFVRQPSIIFADEPSSNLDPEKAQRVIQQLKDWLDDAPDQRSVILVTHDYKLASVADDLIILRLDGRLHHGGERPTACPKSPDAIAELARAAMEIGSQATPRPAPGPKAREPNAPLRAVVRLVAGLRNSGALALQETFGGSSKERRLAALSFSRFRHWQSLTMFTILILLLGGLLHTKRFSQEYFEKEMADPLVRHVVISGHPLFVKETHLTPQLVEELSKRQWLPNRGIFPRIGKREELVIERPGSVESDEPLAKRDVEVLSLKPEEDIAGATPLLDVHGNPTKKTLAQALQEADKRPGRIAIALDRQYFEEITRTLGVPLDKVPELLRLQGRQDRLPFDFIGLYDKSVPDRGYVYQGIMSMTSHTRWAAEQDPGALDELGRPKAYQRLAVYFDHAIYNETLAGLVATRFVFSRDSFQRLARLIDVSQTFKRWLTGLINVVGAFALLILLLTASALLARVWRSALILFAHGVSSYVFALSISLQIVLVLGFSALLCYGLAHAIAGLTQDWALVVTANEALPLLGAAAVFTVFLVFVVVRARAPSRTGLGEQLKSA